MSMYMYDKHLTVKEVAELLSVEEQTIMEWIFEDKLTAVYLGGTTIRIAENELLNFYTRSHYWKAWS